MPRGRDARQHGGTPDYKPKGETPQAHANNSNNRPPSVAELQSKLAGLRQQVAEAVKRHDTGRPTKSHSQRGLRRATRETSAEVSRRGGDPRPHKDSQSTSPQVGQESAHGGQAETKATAPASSVPTTGAARPFAERPMEAQERVRPQPLDHESDSNEIRTFLEFIVQNRGITDIYIDGKRFRVTNVYPLIKILDYTDGQGSFLSLSEDEWSEHVVSLDPPSTTDTSEQKTHLLRGASEDECEEFFGQLKAGDAVVAIDVHGRETPFRFSFVAYDTSSPAVYGRDARNFTQVFYTATSGFMVGPKRKAASGGGDW